MTALIAILGALSLLATQAPADTVVLQGRPTTKVESTEDATTRTVLSEAQRAELEVRIMRRGGRYYWASRENHEVQRRVSGAFHDFVDPVDGGYVRVFDTDTLPESLRPDGPRFQYMEHRPVWRGTVTYWGGADTLAE